MMINIGFSGHPNFNQTAPCGCHWQGRKKTYKGILKSIQFTVDLATEGVSFKSNLSLLSGGPLNSGLTSHPAAIYSRVLPWKVQERAWRLGESIDRHLSLLVATIHILNSPAGVIKHGNRKSPYKWRF